MSLLYDTKQKREEHPGSEHPVFNVQHFYDSLKCDKNTFMLCNQSKVMQQQCKDNKVFERCNSIFALNKYLGTDTAEMPEEELTERFLNSVIQGDEEGVKLFLEDKRVGQADIVDAFELASHYGHAEVVELLLQVEGVEPAAQENDAIRRASFNGHAAVVELLLKDKRADPAAAESEAIRYASAFGHANVVRLLLQDRRANPTDGENYAIRYAAHRGHAAVVRLLLEDGRVDPTVIE